MYPCFLRRSRPSELEITTECSAEDSSRPMKQGALMWERQTCLHQFRTEYGLMSTYLLINWERFLRNQARLYKA